MPNTGRAGSVLTAAELRRLVAVPLEFLPDPPWDYDRLATYRSPHQDAALDTSSPGDAQEADAAVVVAGTASFAHPVSLPYPAQIAGLMIVAYFWGQPLLYSVVRVSPPVTTVPGGPSVDIPVVLWDCFPGG
jgi:hypothetical protein